MNYITSQEAAEKWGLTRRSVQLYCQSGKIPGAINPGKQWLIPEDAEQPQDTRFKENKQEKEPYHFPLLVYTKYFVSRSELSEDESALLDAQILNLKCDFSESVSCCRKLIDESPSPSVRFGAWFTNIINFVLLGLLSEIPVCIHAMKTIYDVATTHREDYLLCFAFLEQTYRFDHSRFMTIDLSKLSPDALTTYKIIFLGVALFSNEETPESSLRFFEAACREIDIRGMMPASLAMHGLLAALYSRKGHLESKLFHTDEVCRIGFENGIIRLLVKYSSVDNDTYVQRLNQYGKEFASDIRERCIRYRNHWQLAYHSHTGPNPAIDTNIFECEIMMLLAFQTPMADIAMLKSITAKELRQTIRELCERLGVGSKKELAELFKKTFGFDSGEPMPVRIPFEAEEDHPAE